MTVRDSQKSKVFKAETVVRKPELSRGELEALGTKIVKSAWFNKQAGTWNDGKPTWKKLTVHSGATHCEVEFQSRGGEIVARLASPYRSAIDLYHVIAHALTQDQVRRGKAAWHGPEFCKTLLGLVARWEGTEAKKALLEAFRAHRVKNRVYTEEAREGMRQRAANRYALEGLKELAVELAPSDNDE